MESIAASGATKYENEYTYNGESYNPNIQSQYLRARYYCVVHASFLTEDSYLGNLAEPLTLNRYNYCVSSWLNYEDPSGNYTKEQYWEIMDYEYSLTPLERYEKGLPTINDMMNHLIGLEKIGYSDATVEYIKSYNYRKPFIYDLIEKVQIMKVRCEITADTKELPQIAGIDNLGYLSGIGESNGNPGKISSGNGDSGGKSYGVFQFASNAGVPWEFINWLQKNNEDMHKQLYQAYFEDENPYGSHFDQAWINIASDDEEEFLKMQYLFTQQKYYDAAANNIKEEIGFDFNERGYALKNVLWSRVVQHGNEKPILRALARLDLSLVSDEDIIRAIYQESGCVVDEAPSDASKPMAGKEAEQYGIEGKYMKYFSKNSSKVQIGVWIRLTENSLHPDKPNSEVDRAIELLQNYY